MLGFLVIAVYLRYIVNVVAVVLDESRYPGESPLRSKSGKKSRLAAQAPHQVSTQVKETILLTARPDLRVSRVWDSTAGSSPRISADFFCRSSSEP